MLRNLSLNADAKGGLENKRGQAQLGYLQSHQLPPIETDESNWRRKDEGTNVHV